MAEVKRIMQEDMMTKQDKYEIMSALDGLIKSMQRMEQELVFTNRHLHRHDVKPDNHETRIKILELR